MSKNNTDCGVTLAPLLSSDSRIRYEVGNLQGIGARERQEDSFTLINTLDEEQYNKLGLMFVVCDGMGGMKDGRLASNTAIGCLRTFFDGMDRTGNIPEQLKSAVCSASEAVEQALGGDGGSTVVAGIILHERLYFASVGDSFLYLFRKGGLYRLNAEHNICHQLYLENIRKNSTETASCRGNIEAAALTNYLGMPGMCEVDLSVRPLPLHKDDVLLACSDGVAGVINESEIKDALEWPVPDDKCKRLEEHIIRHKNPTQDNYTALVVRCV